MLSAAFAAGAREATQVPPPSVPEVAFAGRSNVGKSTLLNAICQRHALARTSRTPGCTRGINMFDVRFRSGASLRLVDLPGYGFAERSKSERRSWGGLIERYLRDRPTLKLVIILVDARRGPEQDEMDLVAFLSSVGAPFMLVATKVDKLSRSERGVALKTIAQRSGARVLGVSGETREGRDALVRTLLAAVAPEPPSDSAPEPSPDSPPFSTEPDAPDSSSDTPRPPRT